MAKKRVTLTKEILADILEKNPNKTLSQVVEILNKGTPSIKYVTPGLDRGNEASHEQLQAVVDGEQNGDHGVQGDDASGDVNESSHQTSSREVVNESSNQDGEQHVVIETSS